MNDDSVPAALHELRRALGNILLEVAVVRVRGAPSAEALEALCQSLEAEVARAKQALDQIAARDGHA